jgi:hypothetical protein
MKLFALLLFLSIFSSKSFTQLHHTEMPELKNLNPMDTFPENTLLGSYTNSYDILISLNGYSTWGMDNSIKILAHNKSGWFKIEINRDEAPFDTVSFSTFKLEEKIGDTLRNILEENHLFDMSDERMKEMPCIIKRDTVLKKRKK